MYRSLLDEAILVFMNHLSYYTFQLVGQQLSYQLDWPSKQGDCPEVVYTSRGGDLWY
jgi:hypothetical protein